MIIIIFNKKVLTFRFSISVKYAIASLFNLIQLIYARKISVDNSGVCCSNYICNCIHLARVNTL